MRALLFLGGAAPAADLALPLLEPLPFVACADSGLDLCLSWGLKPDLALGDFDSLSSTTLLDERPWLETQRFPRDKDYTDAELGLIELRKRGYDQTALVGGGAGRLDHLLALFCLFERGEGPFSWLCQEDYAFVLDSGAEAVIPTSLGSRVSLFPLEGPIPEIESKGLKWPLKGLRWERGYFGISNEATTDELRLRCLRGRALVILPYQALRAAPAIAPASSGDPR
jgi:thiamine pyrophosphokinase